MIIGFSKCSHNFKVRGTLVLGYFSFPKSSGRVVTSENGEAEPRDEVELYHASVVGVQLLKYLEERLQSHQAANEVVEVDDELVVGEASDDDLVQLAGQLEACFF